LHVFAMPVFFVATASRSLTLESPRTRQRKPLLSVFAKSLFLLNLPTVQSQSSFFSFGQPYIC
ncbi:hypothetical protein IJT93_03625, partial [bacterium]|nr:hypothetical protein [bacterium]